MLETNLKKIATASLSLTALLLLTACDNNASQQTQAAPPPTVTTVDVATTTIQQSSDFVGRLVAIDTVDLVPRVEGFLEQINVQDGQLVEKGQSLFLIEPIKYQAQLQSALAGVAQANAEYDRASEDLKRAESLITRGNISQARLDEAIAAEKTAKANQLARQAELEQAELNLSYTEITAPFYGQIGVVKESVGQVISPSTGALTNLVSIDPIFAEFSIGEGDFYSTAENHKSLGLVTRDNPLPLDVQLILPNGKTYEETGKIIFIDNQFDQATASLKVRAEFPNPDGALLPGGFVTVRPFGQKKADTILIPQSSVQRDMKGSFVLVVDGDNKVEQRYVELGEQIGRDTIVKSGLNKGETIIFEGLQKARPGAAVTPKSASRPDGEDTQTDSNK